MPAGSWRATWLVAVAIAVGLAGVAEWSARRHHQLPSVDDDASAWATVRRQADGDPDVVAFVGTSRTTLGLSVDAFAAAAPGSRPLQLGVNGMQAFTSLADFAADPDFRGIVVFELIETEIPHADALHDPLMQPFLDRAHAVWRAPGAIANRYLAGWVQSWLAVLAFKGERVMRSALKHLEWPPPTWVAGHRDRVMYADYSLMPAVTRGGRDNWARSLVAGPADPPDHWLAKTQLVLEPLFRQIRAHGGDVVVLHLPTTGELGAGLDRLYPRAQYWDAFARLSSAHVWHFRDLPAMANIECGDQMHVSGKDQATVTRALVEQMRAQHVLRTP